MRLPRTKHWATVYMTCAAVHAVAGALDFRAVRLVTKAVMMPTLASWVRAQHGPPLLLAALLVSAVGDSLMELGLLLPAMAFFAAAHACYVAMFVRGRRRSSWQLLAAYAVLWAGAIALLWPRLGELRVPVAVYSLMVTATAVTAGWYGRRTGLGGALFLLSDSLIGARLAGHDFPGRSHLVGLTYTAAQYELTSGVLRLSAGSPPEAATLPSSTP